MVFSNFMDGINISSNINKADDAQYIFGVFSILIALLG